MPEMPNLGGGAATLQRYLSSIKFPVDKQQLVEQVRQQNPPDEVMSTIEDIDEGRYDNAADVSKAISGKLM